MITKNAKLLAYSALRRKLKRPPPKMKKFIEELKRRHVIKATLSYLVVAWVLLEVSALLLPMFEAQIGRAHV